MGPLRTAVLSEEWRRQTRIVTPGQARVSTGVASGLEVGLCKSRGHSAYGEEASRGSRYGRRRGGNGSPPDGTRSPGAGEARWRAVPPASALAKGLAERGAEILEGPVQREYGQRELVVRDCNGLVLALGEESASSAAATHTGSDILQALEKVPPLSADDAAVMLGVVEENRSKVGE